MPLFDDHITTVDNMTAKRGVVFPPADTSWISHKRVKYVKDFIEMLFYLLALPWLALHFFTNPLTTLKVVGQAQAG